MSRRIRWLLQVSGQSRKYIYFYFYANLTQSGFCQMENLHLQLIRKPTKIVSYIRSSTTATDILEGEKRVQAAIATILHWFYLSGIPLGKLKQLDTATLSSYECNNLKKLCAILKNILRGDNVFEHENCVTISRVIPCVWGLEHKMLNVSSKFNSSIVKALEASLVKKTGDIRRQ